MNRIILGVFLSLIYLEQAQAQFNVTPDTSVNEIKLNDQRSFKKRIGVKNFSKVFESDTLLPRIECVNNKGNQILRLFFHYGGAEYSVDQIEILSIPKGGKPCVSQIKLDDSSFITSNGIRLGMKKGEVVGKLGKDYKTRNSGIKTILFYVNNSAASLFLKRYNQPEYFIKCVFVKGILISYTFGFSYI